MHVYAIFWKINTCLVLSLSKRVYTLRKETDCTEKLYKPLMLCYLRLKKYTPTWVSMLWTMKLRIHHSRCCASRSMLDHHILSSCSASASPFSCHDVSSTSDWECTDVFLTRAYQRALWASRSVGATMKMLWSLFKQVSLTLKVNSPT